MVISKTRDFYDSNHVKKSSKFQHDSILTLLYEDELLRLSKDHEVILRTRFSYPKNFQLPSLPEQRCVSYS